MNIQLHSFILIQRQDVEFLLLNLTCCVDLRRPPTNLATCLISWHTWYFFSRFLVKSAAPDGFKVRLKA